MKTSTVDLEIIGLQQIIIFKNKKELTQAEHIARRSCRAC